MDYDDDDEKLEMKIKMFTFFFLMLNENINFIFLFLKNFKRSLRRNIQPNSINTVHLHAGNSICLD